jgi:hypothetical protein
MGAAAVADDDVIVHGQVEKLAGVDKLARQA